MGSSTTGKKHKKDKKHKHHSKSPTTDTEEVTYDLTGEGEDSSSRRHHKHKKHKEYKEHKHKRKHREHDRERQVHQVIVQDSDSDSSDCVEVPVDASNAAAIVRGSGKDAEIVAPPPPQLSKHADYERERERREYERAKDKEREYERGREKEKQREYERAREKERERDKERERERERYDDRNAMASKRGSDDYAASSKRMDYGGNSKRDDYPPAKRSAPDDYGRRSGSDYMPSSSSKRDDYERERERERSERERSNRERNERPERGDREHRERNKSHSPIPESGAGDCLSIEETNKLRAKLGLKPLEVDTGPIKPAASSAAASEAKKPLGEKNLSSYKDEWGEFLHKPADNLKEKAQAEKMREKLKQRKEKRFLEERLAHIRTLGESDDEVDDVSRWVERNKRAVDAKKEAEMREKALEEMDAEFGVDDLVEEEKAAVRRKAYNDKHLKGLRVEHDMEDFTEGKAVILTLKDKDVLDEEAGDTLINVNMIDDERYRKNVENKKQNPLSYGYNVYEEQYDQFGNPIERGILEKYDEDVDGKPRTKKNFVIGENMEEQREHKRKLLEIKTKLAGKRLETLADTRIQLASDTFSEVELATFKKPKKKVKKMRQKFKAEDLLPLSDETAERHLGRRGSRPRHVDDDDEDTAKEAHDDTEIKVEEDEEDLARVLSKARKLKQKENIIKKPLSIDMEAIKQEIKTEAPNAEDADMQRGVDGNIILNATAEFCRTLGDIPTYGMAGNRDEDSNDMMDFEEHEMSDERTAAQQEEPELNHGTWNSVNPDEIMRPVDLDDIAQDVEEVAILDEEPDVGAGVANALRLALSKGYLEKEEHNRPSNSKMAHLQAKNYSIEDKSAADDDKFGRRDRFHSGMVSDFRDKDNFKPNVKLEYIDDNGRILNLKEAFRYLSHKFHGKGPGKNKIEKRLKKMEQDGLMKTMSSTDTPLGTLTMLQQKQKETKTPYVVLSGGKQTAAAAVSSTTISKYK